MDSSGIHHDVDSSSAEYRAGKFISDNINNYTSVNLVVLSNYIINNPEIKKLRIASKPVFCDIWDLKKIYGIIVFDDIYMSTKEVFQRYDALSIEGLICNKDDNENDLEQAAFSLPGGNKIKEIKADLTKCGCVKALMSGSGGSVVGLCKKEQLNEIYNLAKRKYQRVWKFESI